MCVLVGALPTVTSNTKTYLLPSPGAAVTEMLPPSEHHAFVMLVMLQPFAVLGPCPSTNQLPVRVGNCTSTTFVAPVNCTAKEFSTPSSVAPVVSISNWTRKPVALVPAEVKVQTTPPSDVLSALATAASPKHRSAK